MTSQSLSLLYYFPFSLPPPSSSFQRLVIQRGEAKEDESGEKRGEEERSGAQPREKK